MVTSMCWTKAASVTCCAQTREVSEEEGASSTFEDIPEEPEDPLDHGFFGLFDEVDSMMGRHRRPRGAARSVSMDLRTKPGYPRSRSACNASFHHPLSYLTVVCCYWLLNPSN